MPEDENIPYIEPETQQEQEVAQYEVFYKTADEINMEKLKTLSNLAICAIIDEENTNPIANSEATYKNLFNEEELYVIKTKILEIVNNL